MARIVVLQGPGAGAVHELGAAAVIGRLAECDIPIDAAQASREHARIERRGDHYVIADLGSSNGTLVNGEKITEHRLRPGDGIVIGSVQMRFEDPEAATGCAEAEPDVLEALAAPAAPEAGPQAVPAPPPQPPRVYPQQYWLLLGCLAVSLGCLTAWEREHVFGREAYGFQRMSGAFVLLFGIFGVFEATLGILRGRVRVLGAGAAGILALIYGLRAFSRTVNHEGFRSRAVLGREIGAGTRGEVHGWIDQFGPGVWLTLFGGAIILCVLARSLLAADRSQRARQSRRVR